MNKVLSILISVLILQACNSTKPTSGVEETAQKEVEPTDKKEAPSSFIIGEGGGFTGLYKLYRVSSNGNVDLYDEEKNSYSKIGKLTSAISKDVFEELVAINLKGYEYYKPGNMNYRITISGEDRTNVITWSDSHSPDETVLLFYKKVMNEISALL